MIANRARPPLAVALLAVAAMLARGHTPAADAEAKTGETPKATIHFVPGTATIVPADLVYLAGLDARERRVVIAAEQYMFEPAELAQRRVDAIAAIVSDHGETGRVVVVTTEIEIEGDPPAPPTDDATIELR